LKAQRNGFEDVPLICGKKGDAHGSGGERTFLKRDSSPPYQKKKKRREFHRHHQGGVCWKKKRGKAKFLKKKKG